LGENNNGQPSLADWLLWELNTKYNIPEKPAYKWIGNEELIALLDGLDEVASTQRENCVRKINDFCLKYGLVSLVVYSRIIDYEELSAKLRLQSGFLLQPLTEEYPLLRWSR
jgi:predicted NACHT family NTPase